jgi:hypothetical protein
MPGNIRKNQAMSLVTLRHRVTMSGVLGFHEAISYPGIDGGDLSYAEFSGGRLNMRVVRLGDSGH